MSDYNYLDKTGLTTLWSKIKSYISSLGYTTNKGTVGGSGTSGYLAKWTGTTAVGNGPQLGNSTVTYLRNDGQWGTPIGTTYSTATSSANGLMSSGDKTKLDGIANNAEVNQNAFSKVTVGSSTVQADAKTDTLTLVGSGSVSLSANTSSDTITISATNTTYGAATTGAAGLMSADDKKKLNSVASSATYNLAFKTIKVGTTNLVADAVDDTLTITAGNNITLTPTASSDSFTIAATNTTYGVATTAANGLMSSADKAKLNGLQSYWQYNSTNDTIELIFPS